MFDDRLIGADAMAEYLGISRRHFFRLKARYRGTKFQLPVFTRFIGQKWGKRTRIIWVFKRDLARWYYQHQNL